MPIITIQREQDSFETLSGAYRFNSNPWWQPKGLIPANVIAAYRFKGAESEARALLDLSGKTLHTLHKTNDSVVWNFANGFTIPAVLGYGLDNTQINDFAAVFIRYSDVNVDSATNASLVSLSATHYLDAKVAGWDNGSLKYRKRPGFSCFNGWRFGAYSPAAYSQAVLGWNRNTDSISANSLYINGSKVALTEMTYESPTANRILIGQSRMNGNVTLTSLKVQAAVFYNTHLTDEQAMELSLSMAEL
jgi:hypothetical protein